ncbi:MAG: polyphosphate polymerase domain-containing protein [Clostridia bacterium]|nr:polyphosphate polymerase domain-containing protein [Clostridia bacterium]
MAFQTVFKRYELKYLLTCEQRERLLLLMNPYMLPDLYGKSTIRNIYFDTESYRLIRRSIEKPTYKEKLRIRSYERATPDSTVFVELKKKYRHVVFKRRMSLTEHMAMAWVCGRESCPEKTQIAAEIDYFLKYYGDLRPTVFLSYEREAYYPADGSEFRVTFDQNVLCRETDLSLCADVGGIPLLGEGISLMELKCAGGLPLWMVRFLSEEKLYKTSFSKYGNAYETLIFPKWKENKRYVSGIV